MLKASREKLESTVLELHCLVGLYAASRVKLVGEGRLPADELGLVDFYQWAVDQDIYEKVARDMRSLKGTREKGPTK